jgi:hypothetical protein
VERGERNREAAPELVIMLIRMICGSPQKSSRRRRRSRRERKRRRRRRRRRRRGRSRRTRGL